MERSVSNYSDNITSSIKFNFVSILEKSGKIHDFTATINRFAKENLLNNFINLTGDEILLYEEQQKLPPRIITIPGLSKAMHDSCHAALLHWHNNLSNLAKAVQKSFGINLQLDDSQTIEELYSNNIEVKLGRFANQWRINVNQIKEKEVFEKIIACGNDLAALNALAYHLSQVLHLNIQPHDLLNPPLIKRIIEKVCYNEAQRRLDTLHPLIAKVDLAMVSREIWETLTLVTPDEVMTYLDAEGNTPLHLALQDPRIVNLCETNLKRMSNPFRLKAFRAFCHFDPTTLQRADPILKIANATLEDMLRAHATRRLDLFYLQACGLTGNEFIVLRSPTMEQHGRGNLLGTQAAHSCLLPALKVLSKQAYEFHFNKIADWINTGMPFLLDPTKFKNEGRYFISYVQEMHSYLQSLAKRSATRERGRKRTVLFQDVVDPIVESRRKLSAILLHEGFLNANGIASQAIEKRINHFFDHIESLKSEEHLKTAVEFTKEMIVLFLNTTTIAERDPLPSLKDSMNATVELPAYANQICDDAIERELRYPAERLLTQVSQNQLTSSEATRELNQEMIRFLREEIGRIHADQYIVDKPEILFVLNIYLNNSLKYSEQFEERLTLLNGLKVQNGDATVL